MKKVLSFSLICLFMFAILAGCGAGKANAPAKTEEELRAEIKAEMEAEEELKAKIRAELEAELQSKAGMAGDDDSQQKEGVKQNSSANDSGVIYTNNKDYWEYKTNTRISADLDGDYKNEEILMDTKEGRLYINSNFIELDMMSIDDSSFVIIDYYDKYFDQGELGKLIGVKDFGPSDDYTTTFYVYWTKMDGRKMDNPIFSVGTVGGLISRSDTYDKSNPGDFNSKLIMTEEGLYAPVRMEIVHTWWGRNIFTYYSTYKSLMDNINKYGRDYDTDGGNNTLFQKGDNLFYSEKDERSSSIVVKGGQNVKMVKTDDKSWVYMIADDGNEGWVPAATINDPRYEGFAFYD